MTDRSTPDPAYRLYKRRLHRILAMYMVCLIGFLLVMALAEKTGLSRQWIGGIFLFATVGMYAGIGIYNRTSDAAEYYVAGRRVPAMYNGIRHLVFVVPPLALLGDQRNSEWI